VSWISTANRIAPAIAKRNAASLRGSQDLLDALADHLALVLGSGSKHLKCQ
jgi:hypothetical protein